MIESIDTSLIDWSRAQFAMTAMYHWIFVPLTLGLAVVMGIMAVSYTHLLILCWPFAKTLVGTIVINRLAMFKFYLISIYCRGTVTAM